MADNEKDRFSFPFENSGPLYILAPFVPTPNDVVERMLELAQVTSADIVYDLGCGDGRILITAAKKYGARGFGVDIEPYWVAESQARAKEAGVDHLATFSLQDAMTVDLSPATVVMIYAVQWAMEKLEPLIKSQVKPGTRVVSHSFAMGDWEPVKTETFTDANGSVRTLYLWTVEDGVGDDELVNDE